MLRGLLVIEESVELNSKPLLLSKASWTFAALKPFFDPGISLRLLKQLAAPNNGGNYDLSTCKEYGQLRLRQKLGQCKQPEVLL